jgi:CoA-transferase family III
MGIATAGPLHGIRVIETGVLLAGPFCARLLGDFGAEVIKIEAPGEGDPMRATGQALFTGPGLGEHNLEVYGTVLGFRADELETLAARGVI